MKSSGQEGGGLCPQHPSPTSISRTTSMPSVTSPNTTCFPSSQSVLSQVMKNWEPLVFGPEFAMDTIPGIRERSVMAEHSSCCFSPAPFPHPAAGFGGAAGYQNPQELLEINYGEKHLQV